MQNLLIKIVKYLIQLNLRGPLEKKLETEKPLPSFHICFKYGLFKQAFY